MLHQTLSILSLTLVSFFFTASASPLYSRDVIQTQSTRTTTCLSSSFGGCCVVDEYGLYSSCTNATLLATNVAWTGIPTTLTANEWACASPVNGSVINAGCCAWSYSYVDITYPNGVVLPTLETSMACGGSSAGVSRK